MPAVTQQRREDRNPPQNVPDISFRPASSAAPSPAKVITPAEEFHKALSAVANCVKIYNFPRGALAYDYGHRDPCVGEPQKIDPGSWQDIKRQIEPHYKTGFTIAVTQAKNENPRGEPCPNLGAVIAAIAALQVDNHQLSLRKRDFIRHPFTALAYHLGFQDLADRVATFVFEYYTKGDSSALSPGKQHALFQSLDTAGATSALAQLSVISAHFRRLARMQDNFTVMSAEVKSLPAPVVAVKVRPGSGSPGFMSLRHCQLILPQMFDGHMETKASLSDAPLIDQFDGNSVIGCLFQLSKSVTAENTAGVVLARSRFYSKEDSPPPTIKTQVKLDVEEGLKSSMTPDFPPGASILLYPAC